MPPKKQRGGPVTTRNRPHTANHPEPSVTPGADMAAGRRRRARTAHASVYAPHPGRAWWWIAYLCPYCGAGHLGRARTEAEVPGPRRSRCGHLVVVVVARTYRGREAA